MSEELIEKSYQLRDESVRPVVATRKGEMVVQQSGEFEVYGFAFHFAAAWLLLASLLISLEYFFVQGVRATDRRRLHRFVSTRNLYNLLLLKYIFKSLLNPDP